MCFTDARVFVRLCSMVSALAMFDVRVDCRFRGASPACPRPHNGEIGFISSSCLFLYRACMRASERTRRSCASACGSISPSLGLPGGSKYVCLQGLGAQ